MEPPARVNPPAISAARCDQYTSSDEEGSRRAPTTDDRVASKRPMTVEPSAAEAMSVATGPIMGQGSTSDTRAPKRRRLIRMVDDDDEEEEAAPTLVRRPRSRLDVASSDGGRVAGDPLATHIKQARPRVAEAAATVGRARRRFFSVAH